MDEELIRRQHAANSRALMKRNSSGWMLFVRLIPSVPVRVSATSQFVAYDKMLSRQ